MELINQFIAFIKVNFFCDLRTSIVSIIGIIAAIFFIKLINDKGDKVNKTLEYLAGTTVFFSAFVYLY